MRYILHRPDPKTGNLSFVKCVQVFHAFDRKPNITEHNEASDGALEVITHVAACTLIGVGDGRPGRILVTENRQVRRGTSRRYNRK